MAKKKRRAVPSDLWLERATDAQIEKMKAALGILPPVMVPANAETREAVGTSRMIRVSDLSLPEGKRDCAWSSEDFTASEAYVIEQVKPTISQGVPSYRLLKLRIERGQVVAVEAGVENLRETVLQDIEDHILRDA